MKKTLLFAASFLFLFTGISFSQKPIVIDLHNAVKNGQVQVFNREYSLIDEKSHKGIRLGKEYGEGIAWFKDINFSEGTIEFDVRGEDVKQHSFVGIAFHGKNNTTFDAIYLRPFHFKAQDEASKNKQIQYISWPDYTWQVLREKYPNTFERAVEGGAPDPNSWVHVRIVIKGSTVSTYINGNKTPSLVIKKVTSLNTGSIGFYVADTSGGDFANISITKTK